ncbi:MAG: alanine--tRNA ligase-related protein [Actinomycetota bacterium]|nr:alanine--tRNA ligase-related protein [Actinomycetota bacterium]
MNTKETLTTFLEFFRERGHQRLTGTSLIPSPQDPVLFTTSGMHPLTPYLAGRSHPLGKRLVNVQRCLRTTDLEQVGDDTHLTVFQMLGSWSLGDYRGSHSLRWGYELLRDGFGIDPGRLHVTVFGGDEEVGPDIESQQVWSELGVPVELTVDDNWWSNGPTGPCGPDTEIFVWCSDTPPQGTPTSDDRWVELWNHVMLRYRRLGSDHLEPLDQSNVDTGMGLERLLMVLQGTSSVFECDVFEPWMRVLPDIWGVSGTSLRIVSDHLRSGIVVLGDGVRPSNTGRGYVLRRLIRRGLTTLWHEDPTCTLVDLPSELFEHTLGHFGQGVDVPLLRGLLQTEERRFRQVLERGRPLIERLVSRGSLTDEDLRYLHDTHGLPRDLVVSVLRDQV